MPVLLAAAVYMGLPLHEVLGQTNSAETKSNWKQCDSMPEGAVFAATVVGINGYIYVLSGFDDSNTSNLSAANRVYDPLTDRWTHAARVPTPRSEPGAAVAADGTIYLIGGNPTLGRKQSSRMNIVEAFHPESDRWSFEKNLPAPRTSLQAVAAKDTRGHLLIYAIGGRNFDLPGNGLNIVEAFDPATKTWARKSPMLMNLHAMAATAGADGKIYVAGGTSSTVDNADTLQVYDPETDHWSFGAKMPYGQECASATSISDSDSEILVLGGWGDTRKIPLASVIAYNVRTRSWRSLVALPFATSAGGAVTVHTGGRNCIFLLGGIPDLRRVQKLEF